MYRDRSVDRTWGQLTASLYVAPQGTPDALGPGSAASASIKVNSQLEPGPCGGPSPQNAARKS